MKILSRYDFLVQFNKSYSPSSSVMYNTERLMLIFLDTNYQEQYCNLHIEHLIVSLYENSN